MFIMSFISLLALVVGIILSLIKLRYGKKFKNDERFTQLQLFSSRVAGIVVMLGLIIMFVLFGFGGLLDVSVSTFKDLVSTSCLC